MADIMLGKVNDVDDDEHVQDEPSSCHLLGALEDLLKRSDQTSSQSVSKKKKSRSKSVDDLLLYQQSIVKSNPSTITRIELDLSGIDADEDELTNLPYQQSRSAPISPTKIYEKELAAFIDCDQIIEQYPADNFVFNIDLSDSNETSQVPNSKLAIFFEDDYLPEEEEEITHESSSVHHLHSSIMNNCLTIAEENEEELEQLRRDDILENDKLNERLSTIYESPNPSIDIDENFTEKLIVYDLAHLDPPTKSIAQPSSSSSVFKPCPNLTSTLTTVRHSGTTSLSHAPKTTAAEQQHSSSSRSSPMLYPLVDNPMPSTNSSHVTKMKVIQSSLSSLSDFISSTPLSNMETNSSTFVNERRSSFNRGILTNGLLFSQCASNPIPRRTTDPLHSLNDKHRSDSCSSSSSSSSSSEIFSSSDEKLLSRSEYLLQNESNLSPQRKSSSLKSISPHILYPIDYSDHHAKSTPKFPTSDSGIVIDTRPASKSSIDQDEHHPTDQLERLYHQSLLDLRLIKQHLVEIENRLDEAMQELAMERALIEGEHELVFKDILKASESDQTKLRELYRNLQILIESMLTQKTSLRNQIHSTQQVLEQLQNEYHQLERATHDKQLLSKKKEILLATRKKYEDFEFQLMEFETRCESEIEQAEKHFQIEQKRLMDNAQHRQNTLHELDQQQYLILCQSTMEKEKLEREKQKFKVLFKQKQIEANEYEQKLHRLRILPSNEYQVHLREKNRAQERPLTRYLPIFSANFDLRGHIENAGHCLNSSHVLLTSTSCRGYLQKMGGVKFKTWNRRWFVFDRASHSLFYYHDKNESKLRGCISFQSIVEVYIDHLQSISLRSPEPRQATFIVKTLDRSFYLVAPTVETMRIWVDVIITGAEGNTFARN